jgi:hypothetical protein
MGMSLALWSSVFFQKAGFEKLNLCSKERPNHHYCDVKQTQPLKKATSIAKDEG